MTAPAASPVADAPPGHWVDRLAPGWLRPYARLARWDRRIGAWLLFWPCAWGAGLAAIAAGRDYPDPWHLALFLVGAYAMRGAGCTWNDLVDRDIDRRVARTASRPLPSGQVTPRQASAFLAAQLTLALAVLLQLNWFSIALGAAALIPVGCYPFMKRITWWPQAFLGICFAYGALMGWAAQFGRLDPPAILLYLGALVWVIGYDTIYALQDIEDDALIGVHSTARLFGARVGAWVAGFYVLTLVLLVAALLRAGAGPLGFAGLAGFAALLARQVASLRPADARHCLALFKANSPAALVFFLGLAADAAL